MNSPSEENKKRHRENFSTPESEPNVLEASTVKCFPAVKRSFRQKQSNWRWRWKYFTRYVFLILSSPLCGKIKTFFCMLDRVVLLELAAIKSNCWYFTSFVMFADILHGNELPVDSRGKHRIILCNKKCWTLISQRCIITGISDVCVCRMF